MANTSDEAAVAVESMDENKDEMISEALNDEACSSPSESMHENKENIKTLAPAGPIGIAVTTAKRRRWHSYSFERRATIRKQIHNRLLKKLRNTVLEYAARIGEQIVIIVATPEKKFDVFGSQPLQNIVKGMQVVITQELESTLEYNVPSPVNVEPKLFKLPPLMLNDIPTSLERMTQAHLRTFIPLMLKYSTGRNKPGWGKEEKRPPWWPEDVPWDNVRFDSRTEDQKHIPWSFALRKIVSSCYKYHGREDLLTDFPKEVKMEENFDNENTTNQEKPITIQVHDLITDKIYQQLDDNGEVIGDTKFFFVSEDYPEAKYQILVVNNQDDGATIIPIVNQVEIDQIEEPENNPMEVMQMVPLQEANVIVEATPSIGN